MPSHNVSPEEIARAAARLRAGKLIAFPTETVYGLGANALDAAAVDCIYAAKGRPKSSPIIVHVAALEMARTLVSVWHERVERLTSTFWPGPLTLVLPKAPIVPANVTAGLETVGIRMPAHPVALDLIRAAGLPIAAPSANRFTELSPTTAEHVRRSLGDRVDMVLDGGPCSVGIESTVISLAGDQPVLLRPGGVARDRIEAIVGPLATPIQWDSATHPAPGLHPRHYSPHTQLIIVQNGVIPTDGRGAYLRFDTRPNREVERIVTMPQNVDEFAACLYNVLHELDEENYDWIAVEDTPETSDWEAVRDRLKRAAGQGGGATSD